MANVTVFVDATSIAQYTQKQVGPYAICLNCAHTIAGLLHPSETKIST